MFTVFIGETELAKIPGLSAAGADVNALRYTAPSDADVLHFGKPRCVGTIPVDPQGHPSPTIITKAAIDEAKLPYLVVCAGNSVNPACPFETVASEPGKDPRFGKAVENAEEIIKRSEALAKKLAPQLKRIVIGESVPGGTTTALLLLRALGYDHTVSSAGPVNPLQLKEKVWQSVSKRLNITIGGLKGKGYKAAEEVGDPMQIAVSAFVRALPEEVDVTLAGGTQMLAVAALLRDLGETRPLLVATTKYVYKDPTSCMEEYAKEIGCELWWAPLDFSKSPRRGFAEYELGYIKEGVGMGGAVMYAMQQGVPIERIQQKAEELYDTLTENMEANFKK